MAIKNSSSMRFAISLILFFSLGCQTLRTRQTIAAEKNAAARTSAPGNPTVQYPVPPSAMHKVAVILGAGGAKAFASVGVLKALQEQRVPIDKVVGLEWGALVAALYSRTGQTNDVEWQLYKMQQKNLPRPEGFFNHRWGKDTVHVMNPYLEDVFGKTTLADAKVPFSCASRSIWTGVMTWQDRGSYVGVLDRCMPFPPIFKMHETFIAAASGVSETVNRLRQEGYDVVILVNVLGSAAPVGSSNLLDYLDDAILWQEVRRAYTEAGELNIDVVNVNTNAYPMTDFKAQKDLIGLGEDMGQTAARALASKYGF